MGYYYSTSKNAFYTDELNYPNLPEDLIAISDSQYQSLIIDVHNGKEITAVNGELTSADKPPVAPTWDAIRRKRNGLLEQTDYTDTLSAKTRLGDTVYNEWQTYRQTLRDIPQIFTNTSIVVWPTAPGA